MTSTWKIRMSASIWVHRDGGQPQLIETEFQWKVQEGDLPPGSHSYHLSDALEVSIKDIARRISRS